MLHFVIITKPNFLRYEKYQLLFFETFCKNRFDPVYSIVSGAEIL